ncbi:hypothetical protein ACWGR4_43685 [Embleya sp. NPDC055664]
MKADGRVKCFTNMHTGQNVKAIFREIVVPLAGDRRLAVARLDGLDLLDLTSNG